MTPGPTLPPVRPVLGVFCEDCRWFDGLARCTHRHARVLRKTAGTFAVLQRSAAQRNADHACPDFQVQAPVVGLWRDLALGVLLGVLLWWGFWVGWAILDGYPPSSMARRSAYGADTSIPYTSPYPQAGVTEDPIEDRNTTLVPSQLVPRRGVPQ
jgi:hypothetical protein